LYTLLSSKRPAPGFWGSVIEFHVDVVATCEMFLIWYDCVERIVYQ